MSPGFRESPHSKRPPEELPARRGGYARLWERRSGFMVSADGESAFVSPSPLRQLSILDELEDSLLAELAGLFVTEHCPEGREVIREGDAGDCFYIVVRGRNSPPSLMQQSIEWH